MIRRRCGTALMASTALLIAASAWAKDPPEPRVRVVPYAASTVADLPVKSGFAALISLAPEEEILQVALGEAADWEVSAQGSTLFLKPRADAASTNLLMVSQAGGELRRYRIRLSLAAPDDPGLYELRFIYPPPATDAKASALDAALNQAAFEGPRNLAYAVQGEVALQPAEVSDNGRFTALRFPGGQPLPAIYAVSADGREQLVNADVRGEFVILHLVAPQLRLRRGGAVLCIFNQSFDPSGRAFATGAATQAVERETEGPRP